MIEFIGELKLTLGRLDITDPCYNKDVWCRGKIDNVKTGDWNAYAEILDEKDWGKRVSRLMIVYDGFQQYVNEHADEFKLVPADIGVDAGLCGFFEDKPDYGDEDWAEFCKMIENSWPVKKILTPESAGKCVGVVTSSGFGDGGYDAEILTKDGEVIAAQIIYILTEEE